MNAQQQPADDIEAVRSVSRILEPFADADMERIARWALERARRRRAVPVPPPPGFVEALKHGRRAG